MLPLRAVRAAAHRRGTEGEERGRFAEEGHTIDHYEAGGLSPQEEAALSAAWDAYEQGEFEKAVKAAGKLARRGGPHPEVRFLQGVLRLEADDPQGALDDLDAVEGEVSDEALHAFYRGLALFDLARFEESEHCLMQAAQAVTADTGPADTGAADPGSNGDDLDAAAGEDGSDVSADEAVVLYQLACVREFLGRWEEAEEGYRAAYAANPDDFPLPLRVPRQEFSEIVREAGDQLPDPIHEHLTTVPVVVDDLPQRALFDHAEGDELRPDLLGLFVGRNLREESVFEIPGVPSAIYIYQRNLERSCRTRDELREEIVTTLYHELGHYLGLDEEDLRERDLD